MTSGEEDNSPKEKESSKRAIPHEEVKCVPFTEKDLSKTFQIGTNLDKQHTSHLIELILEFANVFVEDMPGVDSDLALHHLHVVPCLTQSNSGKEHSAKRKTSI
ncbi:hypothetical protein LIER_07555 [Lithospermum erythrorhizon]|uniref:Uncharacterized protein n=1 Tax=Lithospermum erythrorhizon TaxID=34254 RepID=A0AAV3PBF2_LITER